MFGPISHASGTLVGAGASAGGRAARNTRGAAAAPVVDLGVTGIEAKGAEFAARPLCDDEIVLFASARHPLARKRRATRPDVEGERLIVREETSATRRLLDERLAREGLRPPLMELGCPETVKRAVAAGLGIGALSRRAIADEVRHRELAEIRFPGFPVRRRLHSVHLRRKHLTRTMTSFLDLLEAAVTEPSRRGSR